MKTLLVPIEASESMRPVLEASLVVARRFGSYVEGFALRPAIPDYVPIDMVSGLTWHADEKADAEAVRVSQAIFEDFRTAHGLSESGAAPTYAWFEKAPAGDAFVSGYSRIFDLIVVGRPSQGQPVPSMATLEAALFESGRPILIIPATVPATIGESIVIAWNGSTETARAVAFAMPFLRQAKRVVVLTVEGWSVPGPSAAQLAGALRRNDLSVEVVAMPAGRRSSGEVLLSQAVEIGADLVIKGAYTQSRLRQMIFGGATSHVLAASTLPVLMAH